MARRGIWKDERSGLYRTDVSLGTDPMTGKRVRRSVYGRTAGEVAEQRDQLKADHQRGQLAATSKQTVEEFLADWLQQTVKPRRSAGTYATYEYRIKARIVPHLGKVKLATLTPRHVERLVNAMVEAGRAPATIQATLSTLRSALSQAERWGIVPRNVARLVELPPVEHHERPTLSVAQVETFRKALEGEWYGSYLTLVLGLGLRRGEGLGLRWQDIDWERGTIAIRQQVTREGKKTVVKAGAKTRKSERVLPAPASLLVMLAEHRQRQVARRLQAARWEDHDLVFPTRHGTPVSPDQINQTLRRIARRAGLGDLRPHDLRHSAASIMDALGVPQTVIRDLLGHTTLDMTNRYMHTNEAQQRDAASRLDELFRDEDKAPEEPQEEAG